MREYKTYSKGQFERMLWLIKAELGLGYIQEVSDSLKQSERNPDFLEYVYAIPTSLSNVRILVYSSVDKRTAKTREHGTDAVRFVIQSHVNGTTYNKRIGKCLRINTLEKNISKTIQKGLEYMNELQRARQSA